VLSLFPRSLISPRPTRACQGGSFIRELHASGVLVKILQEETSFTRTYDERPVMLTGPLATVLAVEQQLLDRMAS
jgi:hypothetical protein